MCVCEGMGVSVHGMYMNMYWMLVFFLYFVCVIQTKEAHHC